MRIALVGGGPAAVCMLESLIHARDEMNPDIVLDVTVFDPSPHPWCGPNYAPDMPEALTNMHTNDMSVRNWEPGHVVNWLKANGYAHFVDTFAPREIIGQYLQDSAEKSAARMNAFQHIRERATKVKLVGHSGVVETPTGNYNFDYIVLCMGAATCFDPYRLKGEDHFFITPYPLKNTLSRVGPDEHVGIIGSGLTAIDLTLGLKASGHRGPITIMSRRGQLPMVRRPPIQYSVQYFTVRNIEDMVAEKGSITLMDLIDLACKELDHAGVSRQALMDEILSERYGLDRLRHQMASVDDGEIWHQIYIKMLVAAIEDAWYFLSIDEKRFLENDFRHIANNLCCPMPRHRATQILELADSGQLNVVRGLQSVSKETNGKFVAIAEGTSPIHLDKVFSAASGESRISPMAAPILDGLVQSGQARPHPLGGLDVERTTSRLIDEQNRPQPRLYALGSIVGGALYLYNAILFLAPRSVHIANSIVKHHQENKQPVTEHVMAF
ncbi:FAD/NAD(P)-binding protein [Paenibacillus sp. ISL-20]|uniref:FAD/NAD(P)-binding protein n=1 Tax=Paenibacillus sp. ISL-20 TaxID=2819163 RepID=UPI001BEA5A46|nr:FAD/NAD(P)-binding protein [Paenibacillus sp. ISL-20]MBT2765872.1 FAD/NAD(P)-binding protein [Paenibacillus sp. ISL-20]